MILKLEVMKLTFSGDIGSIPFIIFTSLIIHILFSNEF
jgi:hypothetical protein